MASVAGIMNGCVSSSSSWSKSNDSSKNAIANGVCGGGDRRFRVNCVATSGVASDPYKTLRIRPGASESEVKKAFRQLALQYHPDVCRGSNCGIEFHQINEAYDIVMSNLRGKKNVYDYETYDGSDADIDEPMRGMDEPDWDMWEEWMGWEGAGIRDYSSHINPYI